MDDLRLVQALREHARGAIAALYDAYADRLYRYCLVLCDSAETARRALCDTFLVAEARISALSRPETLATWMYAWARRECLRTREGEGPAPDEPGLDPASGGPDADLRVLAWNALHSLSCADQEILALNTCHPGVDAAVLLGLRPAEAQAALAQARDRLRTAVAAEILVRKGPFDHADRQISVSRVFDLMPVAHAPADLRERLLRWFSDPEMLPYRRHVVRRAGHPGHGGFPRADRGGFPGWPVAVGTALTSVCAAALVALLFGQLTAVPSGTYAFGTAGPPGEGRPRGALPAHGANDLTNDPEDLPLLPSPSPGTPLWPPAPPLTPSGDPVTPATPGDDAPPVPAWTPGTTPAPAPTRSHHNHPTSRPSSPPDRPTAQPTTPPPTQNPTPDPSTPPAGEPTGGTTTAPTTPPATGAPTPTQAQARS
ncbi:RNA polymerase sigma factor [Bailinhaonella thermotolerans]|uniref:Uncharacterized protein n=1 Tax=Bailinhaonella thermotolerans TaxID=1070861 RepID=A0A3A4A1Y7_9ACTN|nr:sigma-70 family RNA polymerase sigma factor [Bailinhaonella thermotolerans]RJL22581.1 hypothetical protein D5H75_35820 [Bailinhaonella thermotolerans]